MSSVTPAPATMCTAPTANRATLTAAPGSSPCRTQADTPLGPSGEGGTGLGAGLLLTLLLQAPLLTQLLPLFHLKGEALQGLELIHAERLQHGILFAQKPLHVSLFAAQLKAGNPGKLGVTGILLGAFGWKRAARSDSRQAVIEGCVPEDHVLTSKLGKRGCWGRGR